MAEIRMGYIIALKRENEKQIKKIICKLLESKTDGMDDECVFVKVNAKQIPVHYTIMQKTSADSCYLELKSKQYISTAIKAVQILDNIITKSEQRSMYEVVKDYDGVSEYYCVKLYPKYAQFERQFRRIVYTILFQAYGMGVYNETISNLDKKMKEDMDKRIKGNRAIENCIENMSLDTLEHYLFDKRVVNLINYFEGLSLNQIEQMDKNELLVLVKKLRPQSLWERHFSELGSAEDWLSEIKEVHNTRNTVAHNKFISEKEYKDTDTRLNRLNNKVRDAIVTLQKTQYTEETEIDILGSFTFALLSFEKSIISTDWYPTVIDNITDRLSQLAKSLGTVFENKETANNLQEGIGRAYYNAVQAMLAGMGNIPDTSRIVANLEKQFSMVDWNLSEEFIQTCNKINSIGKKV